MSNYCYLAIDARGAESRGTLEVSTQMEALKRIKEMGLFPTKVFQCDRERAPAPKPPRAARTLARPRRFRRRNGKISSPRLAIFTRQLATLLEAGMPMLRGLRILQEQEESGRLKDIIRELCESIENGSSLAEALSQHPKAFTPLYVSMVRAGEIGGALESSLSRLAECMEKSQKLRNRIKAAMAYPCAVMVVALGILSLLMIWIVPRFRLIFVDLMNGMQLPAFTRFVFGVSEILRQQLPLVLLAAASLGVVFWLALRTNWGRAAADRLKIAMPVLGPLFRKGAISRFARTLGTLLSNGVPVLQALTIVKETVGNTVIARVVGRMHENVKQGDAMAPTLRAAPVFPVMVAGMLDIGEQTGALPEMLMKVADAYDDQVDNAAGVLTSILEPLLILFLAVVVGSIVIAMFLPIIVIVGGLPDGGGGVHPE